MKKVVLSCIVALGLFGGAVAQAETATPSCLPNVPWFPVFPWCPPCPTTPTEPETPEEFTGVLYQTDITKDTEFIAKEEYVLYTVDEKDRNKIANQLKVTNNGDVTLWIVFRGGNRMEGSLFNRTDFDVSPGETVVFELNNLTSALKNDSILDQLFSKMDEGVNVEYIIQIADSPASKEEMKNTHRSLHVELSKI